MSPRSVILLIEDNPDAQELILRAFNRSRLANERTKLLPIVNLTTSTEEQDLVKNYQLGCNSYVRKSVDFERFI